MTSWCVPNALALPTKLPKSVLVEELRDDFGFPIEYSRKRQTYSFTPLFGGFTPAIAHLAEIVLTLVVNHWPNVYFGRVKPTSTPPVMRNPCLPCLLVFSAACETAVEIDVPRYPTQLTANGLFTPDSLWQVELSENRYILDSEPFTPVQDAKVQILQAGSVVASLDYLKNDIRSGNSIYRAESDRPLIGQSYILAITHPSYGELAANGAVPPAATPVVNAILDTLDVRQDNDLEDRDIAYAVTIRLDDPPEENFYSLSLFIQWDGLSTIDVDDNLEIELQEGMTDVYLRSENPIVDDPFYTYRRELIFKDVSFNGQQYELKTYMIFKPYDAIYSRIFNKGFVLEQNAYDRERNIVRQPGDTIGVHRLYALLRTTTKEYYDYLYTRDLQASVENNPFAQPVQVFDNVEGGLGIFAGYSQVEKQVAFR